MRIKMVVSKKASPDGMVTNYYLKGREYTVPDKSVPLMFKTGEFEKVTDKKGK